MNLKRQIYEKIANSLNVFEYLDQEHHGDDEFDSED